MRRLPQGSHACRILYGITHARRFPGRSCRFLLVFCRCCCFVLVCATGSAVRVPRRVYVVTEALRPRCPPPLAACGRDFNHAGRIYSSKVNSQLGFFLFFLSFFLFLEAGSISRHHLRRSRCHDSSQSIGLQFRRACSRRERSD